MKIEGLRLEVVWHDPEVMQLEVLAGNAEFSAATRLYCAHGALRDFAAAIAGFPSGRGDQRQVMLGDFDAGTAGGGVLISLACESNAGHSFAHIRLQSDSRDDVPASACFRFPVEAGAVDHFVVDLRQLNDQRTGVAKLAARRRATA